LPEPLTEYQFAKELGRKWRFDYAWFRYDGVIHADFVTMAPVQNIALEVDGAVWVNGRHTRGSGYEKDLEKINTATLMGWRVFRVSTGMVKDGRAVRLLEQVFTAERKGAKS
jgi:very-short-patch-repair endonuclease